tara:strand:- start:310 stop:762 length:453 start_codon:yes stop_codon:yes gene_type:complete
MANFHYLKLFKYILTLLVIYNIISLLVLFLPQKNLKNYFWKFLPYDYSYLTGYPNYLKNLSILNSVNRKEIKEKLIMNESRNIVNIEYWNYNLIIDSYTKDQSKDFEKSFLNLLILTKNNKSKQIDLKKYFISNYKYFTDKSKKKILNNY